jgi:uncharacterized protein involved in response to NO
LAILTLGYRPFFLLATLWAGIAMHVWLSALAGQLELPSVFTPLSWHAHELLYGYLPAVIAGFLLTAVPSWTDRPPLTGGPLAALALLWIAGRIAVVASAGLGATTAAIVDCAFLAALAVVVGREMVAARNYRNLSVVALLVILFAGNLASHASAGSHHGPLAERIGIGVAVALIGLIGGRIAPAFTRTWLGSRGPGRLPAEFGTFDVLAVTAGVLALTAWIGWPQAPPTGALCGVAALLHLLRLSRWAGERTGGEPLVLILHIGYAFVPIGFALVAMAILLPTLITPTAALQAWTAGAIGVMTLAVMTRATLGHSGRPLQANGVTQCLYAAALVAVVARLACGRPGAPAWLLEVAAVAWMMAFVGFALAYGAMLLRPRRDSPS